MNHIYNQSQFGGVEENWFTYQKFYTDIVSHFKDGSRFVEIGSWKGKSVAFLIVEIINSNKNIEVTCVDTFTGNNYCSENETEIYTTFKKNMKPLEEYYKVLNMTSENASKLFANESLDFVFIDASHEYDDVKNDIKMWLPKVKHKGILSGHDYWQNSDPTVNSWIGVKKAVDELLENVIVRPEEGCWIYTKV